MNAAESFDDLVEEVRRCRKCARMNDSERVLGYGCGNLNAKVMFVGEAPGRLGADASLMPFHGDKSGHNFESLLEQVGLSRYDAFVTNAVLCNPKDSEGNNSPPTSQEVANCSSFLRRQIELINPPVVATLGAVALKSCALVSSHSLSLSSAVRTRTTWNMRTLVPLYHPGQRAMIHRSFANQLSDYQFLKEMVTRSTVKKARTSRATLPSQEVVAAVDYFVRKKRNLSYFALHKLLFLAEARHLEEYGERLTGSYVVRQKDGPYFVELHPTKLVNAGFKIAAIGKRLFVSRQMDLETGPDVLSSVVIRTIDETLEKYGTHTDSDLKKSVYLTKQMRRVLRIERDKSISMFNAPLLS
jgi:uracil-DNA glycosylase family 4